jgi:hypothetical protein
MSEVREFLERHLRAIFDGDVELWHATTVAERSLYEWRPGRPTTRGRADGDLSLANYLLAGFGRNRTPATSMKERIRQAK